MAKTRKCHWCGANDTLPEEMKFVMVGEKKPVKKHYHEGCFPSYLKDQEFKDKEAKELDDLRLLIEKIYGLNNPLQKDAYSLLNKLRNGDAVFGGKQKIGKRYKQGYSYPLIKETYEYCEDTINYWNGVKSFEGFMQAYRYGLAIVIDKLYFIEQRALKREHQKVLIDDHVQKINDENLEFETNYKKPTKSNTDITDFLDD